MAGESKTIRGLDEALLLLPVGTKATLEIPPDANELEDPNGKAWRVELEIIGLETPRRRESTP